MTARIRLPFRAVNRSRTANYDPGLQRHHLLPRALLRCDCFAALFDSIDPQRLGFDDFRRNGLLLPGSEQAALRFGLPLHRGPHHRYNRLVCERIGQVEARWSARRRLAPGPASDEAAMRLAFVQGALRRRLLDPVRPAGWLNRRDPLRLGCDFADLDAMADALWPATEP